jgi:hypothetical protein
MSGLIVGASLVETPIESLVAVLCLLSAIPFYYLFIEKGNLPLQWWRRLSAFRNEKKTAERLKRMEDENESENEQL